MSYLLLFFLGMLAALWMKGQPLLTFVLLGAVFPLGLVARIPERFFGTIPRQVLQILIAGGGMYWAKTRLGESSLDLLLVEITALLGMALVVGGVRKEYEMLVTLSVILLGFGGLTPGRPIYLRAFFGFLGMAVLLLYQTRTLRLYGFEGELPERTPWHRQNWGYRLMHIALTVGATFLLLSTVPMPRGRVYTRGLVPVSFDTKQELEFPELWRNWVKPAKTIWSSDPNVGDTVDSDISPSVLSKDSPRLVRAQGGESFDSRDGDGGFGIGKDLVYRVRVPAKLYWVGRLYDRYDGSAWQISPMLRDGRSGLDRFHPRNEQEIEQVFRVEKNVSETLVGAHRPVHYEYLGGSQRADTPLPGTKVSVKGYFGGATFRNRIPDPPWTYRAVSMIPEVGSDNPMAPWESSLRRGWNYRHIAPEIVSARTRQLALDLTAGREGQMGKAMALRDFLRNNYTYNLKARRIPADREVVDYFLFESREGYCQHFAQALTVLARLAGLPSRLATGYLPGDYNALANCFEVYEYHAHAWTQIFIEPWGWLTFDAAPPGELPMRNATSFLGSLMDPFGETWSAYPPEFSKPVEDTRKLSHDRPTARTQEPKEEEERRPGLLSQAAAQIFEKAVLDSGSMEPTPQDLMKAAILKSFEWVGDLWRVTRQGVVDWGGRVWERLRDAARGAVAYFRGLSVAGNIFFFAILAALRFAWVRRRRIARWIETWRFKRAVRRLWEHIEESRHASPATVIDLCHDIAWRLLRLAGQRRPGNLDALEYSAWLEQRDPELGSELAVLAPSIARRLFSSALPAREEADDVYSATARLRQTVFDRLADPTRTNQPAIFQA